MLKNKPYNAGLANSTFETTIQDVDLRAVALRAFKNEYLLDFVNVEDPDTFDEKILENQIVHNIKNFIMAFGKDFAFMGNQYRVIVSGKEYFIDLLFYHRGVRCSVSEGMCRAVLSYLLTKNVSCHSFCQCKDSC